MGLFVNTNYKNVALPLKGVKAADKFGVYKAIVEIPDNVKYPILPVRVNNQIIYPVGKFEGLWTNIELNYALELGYKINVLSAFAPLTPFRGIGEGCRWII